MLRKFLSAAIISSALASQ